MTPLKNLKNRNNYITRFIELSSFQIIMKLKSTKKHLITMQKFDKKGNQSTPNYEKKLKHYQSINVIKDEINLLEQRQRHCLIELCDYDQKL